MKIFRIIILLEERKKKQKKYSSFFQNRVTHLPDFQFFSILIWHVCAMVHRYVRNVRLSSVGLFCRAVYPCSVVLRQHCCSVACCTVCRRAVETWRIVLLGGLDRCPNKTLCLEKNRKNRNKCWVHFFSSN